MAIKQAPRLLAMGAVGTKVAADVLAVRSITVHEELSRLFTIEADLRSEAGDVKFDDVIGQNVTLRLDVGQRKDPRYFNGYISRLVQVANIGQYAHYRATIVPWLWFLTRMSDCRIFLDKSVPDIVIEVFTDHGFDDFADKLSDKSKYKKKEFCVQYRETDFNFVSRLLEQEGIYYYFKHEDGKHTLVLADALSAHKPAEGYEELSFFELAKGAPEREVVIDWTMEKEVQTVAYKLNDFDFKKPKVPLLSAASVTRDYGFAQSELYDYPGEYVEHDDGDRLANVRLDEQQTQYETLRGQATARGVAPGYTFTLKNHPAKEQNREYLITGVALKVEAGESASASNDGGGEFFSCSFTAIASKQTFRPERQTPKPIIQGPQTAMVVGNKSEEIDTDKYGRVKVQFPWDRYGKADENSSCWIRVSQSVAGKGWGAIFTPRIGQEVIVEFLEGDPDRPIITGRVYNGEAMPPYALPDRKTISTLKSNSTKGGGGFNEIRLEDKKGEEQIFIHGEKNLDIRIKKDSFETIGGSQNITAGEQLESVGNNRHETVGKDHKEKIGKDRHLKVGGKEAKEVKGPLSLKVTDGDVIEVFCKGHSEQTTKDYYVKADNVIIEGATSITVKVNGSYLAMDKDGIKISAKKVEIEGTDETSVKGKNKLTLQSDTKIEEGSPDTNINGDTKVTVKGGKINLNC